MGKKTKNKSRNKREFRKASFLANPPSNPDNGSSSSSSIYNGGCSEGNNTPRTNLGVFIDHRMHDDLAHIQSSPARMRRNSQHSSSFGLTARQKYAPIKQNSNDSTRVYPAQSTPNGKDNSVMFRKPSKTNRRESLPLTNKNLQSLLSQGGGKAPVSTKRAYSSVALDMDQYTQDQRRLTNQQTWHLPNFPNEGAAMSDDEDAISINSLQFGESNPSSEHSSDSTSLDDVCFPDYYDHNIDQEGGKEHSYHWPDLDILQEFVQNELEEFNDAEEIKELNKDVQNVNFQFPVAHSLGSHDDGAISPTLYATKKPAGEYKDKETSEDTPLLENAQVNELESLDLMNETFRVRPTPIQPWEKSKDNIPTILNRPSQLHLNKFESLQLVPQQKRFDPNLCRFTYFREDLEKTIHSPTISGLLAKGGSIKIQDGTTPLSKKWGVSDNKNNDLENQYENPTLYDFFMPSYYSQNIESSEQETPNVPISGVQTPAIVQETHDDAASTHLNETKPSLNNLTVNYNAINQKLPQVPKSNLTVENSITAPGTATGSVTGHREASVNPFWLDVLNPTEEEMKVLSRTFGIHPLTTEDIFLGEAREKVELFKSYYFICFTSFDVVYERRKQRAKENEKKGNKLLEMYDKLDDDANSIFGSKERKSKIWQLINKMKRSYSDHDGRKSIVSTHSHYNDNKSNSSVKSKMKRVREGELSPLNMYIIVFRDAVITFHFSATPHPINVRRRARLLRDYLTVSSDWICYALIDDITDSFAPMIESIEEEVNLIEDAILKMHSGDTDSDDDSSDDESNDESIIHDVHRPDRGVFYRRERSKSTVDNRFDFKSRFQKNSKNKLFSSNTSITSRNSKKSSKSSSSRSTSSKIIGWKRKGDMLRRIGECRKRVMSVLRLLGSKADVIKGFSKRFSELADSSTALIIKDKSNFSPKLDIGMYLGDIQDHIVTMVQSLNHYEKLLARFHSNYLAQINIDMTKVNNDTNDVLGKITILGTIVLPINVVTGLWGMNCIVPGQDYEGLAWFWSIVGAMCIFSIFAYHYARRVTGL